MPQMAPYNWLILFLFFNMLIMIISAINHYMMSKFSHSSNLKLNSQLFKWMW